MKHHPPLNLDALRARMAMTDVLFGCNSEDYPAVAEVLGLAPGIIGYDRCAIVLHRLHAVAKTATNGDYALMATRDPVTHARRGYAVYTRRQVTADQIVARIMEMLV